MIFQVEQEIEASVDTIWRHLTNPELMGEWMPGIAWMRSEEGTALKKGSRLVFEARGAERTSSVSEFVPRTSIALTSTQGPFTANYRYDIAATEAGHTMVRLRADCVGRGVGRLLAPLLRPLIRRADQGQLLELKRHIETGC